MTTQLTIQHIADKIIQGSVGIFPFETTCGFTGLATEENLKRVTTLKQRSTPQACLLVIPTYEWIHELANIQQWQEDILHKYWPGPTTFILKKQSSVSSIITEGKETIALRYPSFKPLDTLLNLVKKPLFSTSVNLNGEPPIHAPKEIPDYFRSNVDFCYDQEAPLYKDVSTIVDLTQPKPKIIRKGVTAFEH